MGFHPFAEQIAVVKSEVVSQCLSPCRKVSQICTKKSTKISTPYTGSTRESHELDFIDRETPTWDEEQLTGASFCFRYSSLQTFSAYTPNRAA
jgi:hypothetical protein